MQGVPDVQAKGMQLRGPQRRALAIVRKLVQRQLSLLAVQMQGMQHVPKVLRVVPRLAGLRRHGLPSMQLLPGPLHSGPV